MSQFDISVVLVISLWISFLLCHEVNGYEYDFLNPVRLDGEQWHQRNTRVAIRTNERVDCESRSFYICEEPPNLLPQDSLKTCTFRSTEYSEQVFRWVAGHGCILFTHDFLFVAGFNNINLSRGCLFGNLFAPCLEIPKEDGTCGCFPFDPSFEEVRNAVRQAMVPSAHGRWERCFQAAADCCTDYMGQVETNTNSTEQDTCKGTFDGWTCWQPAAAGTTAHAVCSEFAYSNEGPTCHHFSNKECYANGTWQYNTDYTTCSVTPRLLARYRFHIAMLSFSIACSVPAIVIFFIYKRLRITRVALHRNLLIAIVLRNVLVIVSRTEIYIDAITNSGETVLAANGVACRTLSVAERIAANAVFVCMLVEGVYLHRLIVGVFRKKLNINVLYGIGAVVAVVPVIAWAAVMAVYNDHSCWVIFTLDYVQWILDAPRLLILLINTALFVDVLRVLLTKIRNSENAHQLSTAKTTLFLMPLFGTQFLLTALRPNTTNCAWEQTYFFFAYTFEGLQGFFVALLYCYINKEVRTLLKASYVKTEAAVVSRVRDSSYPRMSIDPKSDRRLTYSTAVASQHDDDPKDQYATIAPKLHVAEIISIQASERLADILEPVYETIENGAINEGYDSLERSSLDNDSGFIANRDVDKGDTYYGFTNVSSVSIDCQDWIKCISSPSSSVYNNSLNDYETRYLEKRFSNHPKLREIVEARNRYSLDIPKESDYTQIKNVDTDKKDNTYHSVKNNDNITNNNQRLKKNEAESEYEDCDDNMFEEIMQYIETTDKVKKP